MMCCPVSGSCQPSSPVLPPDEEIEHAAVALQYPFLDRLNWDGLVLVVYQPVSGEHCPVELSGFVEPPVLGGTQGGIAGPLLHHVPPAGASGGYLHDEVVGACPARR